MILRARVVLPITAPPIEDGAVRFLDDQILAVGRFQDLASSDAEIHDLGEVILMPGLINAHCHLDYTHMGGVISPPNSFVDWIQSIVALKADWTYSDYANSWIAGANALLESGTTCVADIEAVPELVPEVWRSTPLRVHTFHELISVRGRQTPEAQVAEAEQRLNETPNPHGGGGLSPHAPYTTSPRLRELTAQTAETNNWRMCMHVAESATENDMFRHRRGEMHDWLDRNGREMSDCGRSPVRVLADSNLLSDRMLAVHCNYVDAADIDLLRQSGTNVVHCPQSHAYFNHAPFPTEDLLKAGINLSLGTDSLASTSAPTGLKPRLNLFDEMRVFAIANPSITAEQIVEMVTINAARALGCPRQGSLEVEKKADLLAVPFDGPIEDAYGKLVNFDGRESAVMIDGRWIYPPLIG